MMQAWGDWMGRVGPALADGGALTGDHARVGGSGAPLPITGYNIVDADCLEAAKALCDGHPVPRRRTGRLLRRRVRADPHPDVSSPRRLPSSTR